MNDAFTLQKKTLFLTKYKDQLQPKKKVSLLNITFPKFSYFTKPEPSYLSPWKFLRKVSLNLVFVLVDMKSNSEGGNPLMEKRIKHTLSVTMKSLTIYSLDFFTVI